MNKPNCYECKHRRDLVYDAHSLCANPNIAKGLDPIMAGLMPLVGAVKNNLNVTGNPHGIKSGWFVWPLNFDPVWLETCNGFEPKGGEQGETKSNLSQSESQVESVSQSVLQRDERNERPITSS